MTDCLCVVRQVHFLDGYPAYLPGDLREFLTLPAPDAVAWVAVNKLEVVGHVALHPRSSPQVMALASESSAVPQENLRVVARLFVSPKARGQGIGRQLLSTAAQFAHTRDCLPILDVATHYQVAIQLYEACGWQRAGTVKVHFGEDRHLEEYVYLGPKDHGSSTAA